MLKKVEETIVGTIKRIAKGLNIPPVKNKRILNKELSLFQLTGFLSRATILLCIKKFIDLSVLKKSYSQ